MYVGGLAWCCRREIPTPSARRASSLIFLLALPLCIGSINSGQANCLMAGLLLCGIAAISSERWNLAAAALSVACFLKLYPIALVLLLSMLFARKLIPRFAIAIAIGLALPFFFREPAGVIQEYQDWVRRLAAEDRADRPLTVWFHDARLLARVWGLTLGPGAFLSIQLAGGAAIAGVCQFAQLRRRWPSSLVLGGALALACCWMTALGPSTEISTYMLLAAPL